MKIDYVGIVCKLKYFVWGVYIVCGCIFRWFLNYRWREKELGKKYKIIKFKIKLKELYKLWFLLKRK